MNSIKSLYINKCILDRSIYWLIGVKIFTIKVFTGKEVIAPTKLENLQEIRHK